MTLASKVRDRRAAIGGLLFTFVAALSSTESFTPAALVSRRQNGMIHGHACPRVITRVTRDFPRSYLTVLKAEESEEETVSEEAAAAAEETNDEEEEEEKEPKEDPEVTALKEEISSLEKTLNSKRLEASRIRDEADEYSESGYLRRCAEMDNVRKRRDIAFANDRFIARASVVQKFLPILEELNELSDVTYAGVEFAKQYRALRGDLKTKFEKQLDVEEFVAAPGDKLDRMRCVSVSEEFSDDYDKGTVIRMVKSGFEIKGNVMQFAECVTSKGSEAEAKAAEEAKAAAEAKAKAEAEAKAKAEAEAEAEDDEEEEAEE